MTSRVVNLQEACSLITDGTHYSPPDVGTGIPFLTVKDLTDEGLRFETAAHISNEEYERASAASSAPRLGDVLFSKDGTIGKVHVVKELVPFAVLSSIAILRPTPEVLDSRYLGRVLRSPGVLRSAAGSKTGSALTRIILKDLKRVRIPLPPLAEQRRVAAVLDKADGIRRKRRESLRLLDELLRSAFLEMFGDPVRNEKGWEVVRAGDLLSELRYGTSVKCSADPVGSAMAVLRIPNVIGGQISWDELKFAHLSQAEIENLRLLAGDLLFVRTNGNPEYIGRCAVFDGSRPALFASYLIRGRIAEEARYRSAFFKHVLSFPSYRARLVAESRTTAGNFNISTIGLRRLTLIRPPVDLQDRFLAIDERIRKQREVIGRSLLQSATLFDSLAHRAFRGEM